MSFGKRGLPPPASPGLTRNTTAPSDDQKSPPVKASRLLIIGGLLAVSCVVGWGVNSATHFVLGNYVEGQWANRGSLPFDKLISKIDDILVEETDKVELAVHQKCRGIAMAKLEVPPKRKQELLRDWARIGNEDRVQRVADYVACTMSDTPSRFCNAPARGRLFAYIQGYYEVQAHQRRVNEEDRIYNPADAIEAAKAYPKDLLTKTDSRIAAGIAQLTSQGYVARDELLGQLAKPAVAPVTELLQGAEDVASRCPSAA